MPHAEEPVARDDWDEEDLLTIELAVERLREELASLTEQAAGAGESERPALERRAELLRSRVEELQARRPGD